MRDDISDLEIQIEKECRFCNLPEKERILYETDNSKLGCLMMSYI